MGGDKGEGETSGLFTPTLTRLRGGLILPHQGGGDRSEVERKMPRPLVGELHCLLQCGAVLILVGRDLLPPLGSQICQARISP